jgi:hypothetical protein
MKDPYLAGRNLRGYHHVCAFFDSRDEEYSVMGPFFKEGIDEGEKVVHIVDPELVADHTRRLHAHGIDTGKCAACGQLEVLTWDDAYLSGGTFDQDRMMGAIDAVIAAGKAQGYPRMRIMGNMNWTLRGRPGTEEVLEFEARVNEVLSRTQQLAVCVYDTAKISGALMMDILRSHPLTLVGEVIHENPFYTPPETLAAQLRAKRVRAEAAREPVTA